VPACDADGRLCKRIPKLTRGWCDISPLPPPTCAACHPARIPINAPCLHLPSQRSHHRLSRQRITTFTFWYASLTPPFLSKFSRAAATHVPAFGITVFSAATTAWDIHLRLNFLPLLPITFNPPHPSRTALVNSIPRIQRTVRTATILLPSPRHRHWTMLLRNTAGADMVPPPGAKYI